MQPAADEPSGNSINALAGRTSSQVNRLLDGDDIEENEMLRLKNLTLQETVIDQFDP